MNFSIYEIVYDIEIFLINEKAISPITFFVPATGLNIQNTHWLHYWFSNHTVKIMIVEILYLRYKNSNYFNK